MDEALIRALAGGKFWGADAPPKEPLAVNEDALVKMLARERSVPPGQKWLTEPVNIPGGTRGEYIMKHSVPAQAVNAVVGFPGRIKTLMELNAARVGGDRSDETGDALVSALTDVAGGITGSAMMAPAVKGGAGMGIRAYHGSPHDFDKFDASKIGTGEGAQTYGHGLYFAQNEATAKAYRDALARGEFRMADGRPTGMNDPFAVIASATQKSGVDYKRANEIAQEVMVAMKQGDDLASMTRFVSASDWSAAEKAAWKAALAEADKFKYEGAPGRMYEVDIDADPDLFLDWQKPLVGQSDAAKERLAKAGFKGAATDDEFARGVTRIDRYMKTKGYDRDWRDSGDFRREMTKFIDVWEAGGKPAAIEWLKENPHSLVTRQAMPDRSASFVDEIVKSPDNAVRLKEAGIPGIKYLDQGSRGSGEGTSNFVVFDDSLVKVLRKYGIPVTAGAGAAASAAGGGTAEAAQ